MNTLLGKLLSKPKSDINPPFLKSPEFHEFTSTIINNHPDVSMAKLLHGLNCEHLSDEAISQRFHPHGVQTVFYFAFGSNLNLKVFEGRRGITPIQVFAAHLPDYDLVFDLHAMPYLEPVMGNIKPNAGGRGVHGAAFRLTKPQLDRVLETEGGGMSYQLLEVDVHLYHGKCKPDAGVKVRAFTLMCVRRLESLHFPQEALPSNRYLTLIQQGARERGLDEEWIAHLDARPKLKPLTIMQTCIVFAVVVVNLPVICGMAIFVEAKRIAQGLDKSKRLPMLMHMVIGWFWFLWTHIPFPIRRFWIEHRVF